MFGAVPAFIEDFGVVLGVLLTLCLLVGALYKGTKWALDSFHASILTAVDEANKAAEIRQEPIRIDASLRQKDIINRLERVETEVRSPNGIPTSAMVYQMYKRQQAMEVRQGELAQYASEGRAIQKRMVEDLNTLRDGQIEHLEQAALRFGHLYAKLGINEDPGTADPTLPTAPS